MNRRSLRHLGRRSNLLGIAIVALFLLVAIFAPALAPPENPENPVPYKPTGQRFDRIPNPPSEEHPLGTTPRRFDVQFRGIAALQSDNTSNNPQVDVYYTLIWGARSALRLGLLVVSITATLGILVGLVSGYLGGLASSLAMRVTDAFLVFPVIAAVWLFDRAIFFGIDVRVFNPQAPDPRLFDLILQRLDLTPVIVALIAFSWMSYARIINAEAQRLKQTDFVQAARSLGAGGRRIIFRHMLPNVIPPAIVLAARDVGSVVILESAFTFIGLTGSGAWGVLLAGGRDYVIGVGGNPFTYWWTFLPVALALILFSVGWNLLGDGLNDWLNPRN